MKYLLFNVIILNMEGVSMNKNSARKLCFEKLNNISNKINRDKIVSDKLSKLLKGYKSVGIYMPIRNECVLNLEGNFKLCYPRVFGKTMKFYDDSEGFKKSGFGILEPISTIEIIPDIIIAPCVGYFNNYRLGYGGGYYDRYLEIHNIDTIGIAYYETELNNLEVNKYDIALNKIILI